MSTKGYIILSVFSLLFCGCSSSKNLSRSSAESTLRKVISEKGIKQDIFVPVGFLLPNLRTITFDGRSDREYWQMQQQYDLLSKGAIAYPSETKPSFIYKFEQRGLVTSVGDVHNPWRIPDTDRWYVYIPNPNFHKMFVRTERDEFQAKVCRIEEQLSRITGITEPGELGLGRVEFETTFQVQNNTALQELVGNKGCHPRDRTYAAVFRRYDDGWRFMEMNFGSELEPTAAERAIEQEEERVRQADEKMAQRKELENPLPSSEKVKQLPEPQGSKPTISLDEMNELIMSGRTTDLQKMLQSGVSPNLLINDYYTLLGLAAYDGKMEMVKLLLRSGADPNLAPKAGPTYSPLKLALLQNHPDVAEALRAAGAKGDPSAPTKPTEQAASPSPENAVAQWRYQMRHDHGGSLINGVFQKVYCEGTLSVFKDRVTFKASSSNDKETHSFSESG